MKNVRTLAPIRYPGKILNGAGNFYTHTCEGCTPEQQVANDKKIRANRGVPYLFLKPGEGAVIGNNQPIVIPPGRDRIDWEIEFGTVIGRPASYVSANNAQDFVFGYTVTIDISDRGGRPPGGFGSGSDWLVGKGHDTFAPMGPWIVPKEFYGDPMKRLHQQLSIDGVKVLHDRLRGAEDLRRHRGRRARARAAPGRLADLGARRVTLLAVSRRGAGAAERARLEIV